MSKTLEIWAAIERTFLQEDIELFKAGGKVFAPNGDNGRAAKLRQLKARVEHARRSISEENSSIRP